MKHRMENTDRADLCVPEIGTIAQFISSVGRGDVPAAVMLTCWELCDAPSHVAHTRPGEIMVVQNAAGLVPARSNDTPDSAAAAVCYALGFSTVRHLIVCGHRGCRMIPMLLSDRRPDLLPETRELLREVREDVDALGNTVSEPQRSDYAVKQVILRQLHNLKTHACVQKRLDEGDLLLHGWLYDDRHLTIQTYRPDSGEFHR